MRVIARIEQRATPRTITTTLIGLRSAARNSHIAMDLPEPCRARTVRTDQDHLALQRRKRSFARQPCVQGRRQSPIAPINFAPRRPLQLWTNPLGILSAPAFPFAVRRRVPQVWLLPPAALRPGKPAPSGVPRSDPGSSAGVALPAPVHLLLQSPFSDGSRKRLAMETL